MAGQIRIEHPDALAKEFPDAQVKGSTATFGAPFYGERVVGKLVYQVPTDKDHPHCDVNGYSNRKALEDAKDKEIKENHDRESGIRPTERWIMVVERGGCSFVTKVRTAESLGASAVIVVDKADSNLTSNTIHTVIMAGDPYEDKVTGPSILVSHEDGQKIIKGTKEANAAGDEVMVMLNWDIPNNDIVVMDLWMSSASKASNDFLVEFKDLAEALLYNLQFVPHYHIRDIPQDYNSRCLQQNRFCADDPDGPGPITGKDVVEEDLRQLCIWHATAENNPESSEVYLGNKKPTDKDVKRSKKFWEYVVAVHKKCTLDGKTVETRFGSKECSETLMDELQISRQKVNDCIHDYGNDLLKHETDNTAWSPFALRINGWRYAGHIDRDLVKKAICTGYISVPEACQESALKQEILAVAGFGWGTVLEAIALFCVVALAMMYCFSTRFFSTYVRRALQEEVMLEVQSQMADYKVLTEEDDELGSRPQRVGRLPRWA